MLEAQTGYIIRKPKIKTDRIDEDDFDKMSPDKQSSHAHL